MDALKRRYADLDIAHVHQKLGIGHERIYQDVKIKTVWMPHIRGLASNQHCLYQMGDATIKCIN